MNARAPQVFVRATSANDFIFMILVIQYESLQVAIGADEYCERGVDTEDQVKAFGFHFLGFPPAKTTVS